MKKMTKMTIAAAGAAAVFLSAGSTKAMTYGISRGGNVWYVQSDSTEEVQSQADDVWHVQSDSIEEVQSQTNDVWHVQSDSIEEVQSQADDVRHVQSDNAAEAQSQADDVLRSNPETGKADPAEPEADKTDPAGPETEKADSAEPDTDEENPAEAEPTEEDLENWMQAELREAVAPLLEYGVRYDEKEKSLFYQEQKIRLLIDQQIGDTSSSIYMPDGEIDLYTVRAGDYRLTGVRPASREEYDRNTEELKNWEDGNEETVHLFSVTCSEETVTGPEEGIGEKQAMSSENVFAAESDTIATDGSANLTAEESASCDYKCVLRTEEEQERIEEYAWIGIEQDDEGRWLYQGRKVDWLVDENGSIYTNNTNRDRKNRLYVIVKRNEDGSVKEAKEVTLEGAIRGYMEN